MLGKISLQMKYSSTNTVMVTGMCDGGSQAKLSLGTLAFPKRHLDPGDEVEGVATAKYM